MIHIATRYVCLVLICTYGSSGIFINANGKAKQRDFKFLIMEKLIEELKNRHAGANAAMDTYPHKTYHRGVQQGKSAAYEHCIRRLEKLKTHVVLANVSDLRKLLIAYSAYVALGDEDYSERDIKQDIDKFISNL